MITFILKPNPRQRWFSTVRIFDTEQQMRDWHDRLHVAKRPAYNAAVIKWNTWKVKGRQRSRTGNIGEILFYKSNVTMANIAHESLHAALWYARVIGLKVAPIDAQFPGRLSPKYATRNRRAQSREEQLASLTGRIAGRIAQGWVRATSQSP